MYRVLGLPDVYLSIQIIKATPVGHSSKENGMILTRYRCRSFVWLHAYYYTASTYTPMVPAEALPTRHMPYTEHMRRQSTRLAPQFALPAPLGVGLITADLSASSCEGVRTRCCHGRHADSSKLCWRLQSGVDVLLTPSKRGST